DLDEKVARAAQERVGPVRRRVLDEARGDEPAGGVPEGDLHLPPGQRGAGGGGDAPARTPGRRVGPGGGGAGGGRGAVSGGGAGGGGGVGWGPARGWSGRRCRCPPGRHDSAGTARAARSGAAPRPLRRRASGRVGVAPAHRRGAAT